MLVNKQSSKSPYAIILIALFTMLCLLPAISILAEDATFCDEPRNPIYDKYHKDKASDGWFEVYQVEKNIWAIYEPFQWQGIISYLIVGSKSALLFDTGNGMGNIKSIIDQLTDKPIQVINSHSHFDHIGGNYQFNKILSPSTDYSIAKSKGDSSAMIKDEASAQALCAELPAGVTNKNHHIKPYSISSKIQDGDIIDLGDRQIEILLIPGHTPDSVALLEEKSGFLWTGDTFYEGPIWLYFPETDLAAYQKSLARLVKLVPELKALFPGHITPKAVPLMLVKAQDALEIVFQGKQPEPVMEYPAEGAVSFKFDGFGFIMREDYRTIRK